MQQPSNFMHQFLWLKFNAGQIKFNHTGTGYDNRTNKPVN